MPQNTDTPLLALERVTMRYPSVDGVEQPPVLDGLNLKVERGETIAVVGPSGCGKSTLLNLVGALDRPTSGRVVLGGQNLADLGDRELAQLRNRKIGFIFQDHHLLPQCTALENVLVPTLPADGAATAIEHARGLLNRVGLADHAHKRPGQLSGGQRQRVAVVRALINKPALLLADEPTGALDHTSTDDLVVLLEQLNRELGTTLIVVTHARDVAEKMGRVLTLRDGCFDDAS